MVRRPVRRSVEWAFYRIITASIRFVRYEDEVAPFIILNAGFDDEELLHEPQLQQRIADRQQQGLSTSEEEKALRILEMDRNSFQQTMGLTSE
jgi:hypothetical protein